MGITSSTTTKLYSSLIVNRIIAPGIIIGVNKNSKQLKLLEYIFESNIYLTLEKSNEKNLMIILSYSIG